MGFLIFQYENGEKEILGDKEAKNQLKKESWHPYIDKNGRKISQYEAEVIDKYGE
jgi:hypothetical protein